MSPTTWNNSFSVGIEQIDDQHKDLFNCIADLEKSVANPDEKQRWNSIHYSIMKLQDYVRIHFSVEECLMEVLGYPGRAAHIREHNKFVKVVSDLERRSITQNNITANEIVEFLRDWLVNHIAVTDQDYSRYFAKAMNNTQRSPVRPTGLPD